MSSPNQVVLSYNWLPAAKTLVAKIRGDPSSAWLLEMGDSAFGTLETQLEVVWKEQASHVVEELKKLEPPRQQAQALSIPGFIVHLYRPHMAAAWFRVSGNMRTFAEGYLSKMPPSWRHTIKRTQKSSKHQDVSRTLAFNMAMMAVHVVLH